jgi:hypothetical protein
VALKKKKVVEPQGKPVVSHIPIPVSDTALVIDLPDGQKLVVGNMTHGTVIEVATWRGTGRPDSRTNRMMLGMTNAELEETLKEENAEPTKVEASLTMAQKILNPIVVGFKWLFNFKDYDIKGVAKNLKSLRTSDKQKPIAIEATPAPDLTPLPQFTPLPPVASVVPVETSITSELVPIELAPESKRLKIKFKTPKLPAISKPSFISSSISSISSATKSSKSDEADIEAWLDKLMAKSSMSSISKPATGSKPSNLNASRKPVSTKKSISKKAVVKPNKSKPKR